MDGNFGLPNPMDGYWNVHGTEYMDDNPCISRLSSPVSR